MTILSYHFIMAALKCSYHVLQINAIGHHFVRLKLKTVDCLANVNNISINPIAIPNIVTSRSRKINKCEQTKVDVETIYSIFSPKSIRTSQFSF